MLKYCLEQWDKNKDALEKDISQDKNLTGYFGEEDAGYLYLVKKLVKTVLNCDSVYKWDAESIVEIDNGDYQGTLLFVIPRNTFQPSEYDYLMTYIGYGSCGFCDTLMAIKDLGYSADKYPTEDQVKDYMVLMKDILTNMIRPYNSGWREDADFEEVKYE